MQNIQNKAKMPKYEIVHYRENGKDIFEQWLKSLKDKRAQSAIYSRLDRIEDGNFGEYKPCRSGVFELKIDYGAGYRVYYSIVGRTVVLLLCAGDKRTQQKDIDKAVGYLEKYKETHE